MSSSVTQRCTLCLKDKPVACFYDDKRYESKKIARCKDCYNKVSRDRYISGDKDKRYKVTRKWRENNKDKVVKYGRKFTLKKYNLTLEEYERLLDKQGGCCAICGASKETYSTNLSTNLMVDHDHETGRVRGLLCSGCNTGIGHLNDSISVLKKAIDYLSREDN